MIEGLIGLAVMMALAFLRVPIAFAMATVGLCGYADRRAALAAFSGRLGISFVDLTAGMRAVSPDTVDWFFITPSALPVRGLAGHYSAAGNRWVAARLAERLGALPDVASAVGSLP